METKPAEKKIKYKTKQAGEIEAYLATIPGQHVTVQDVCAYFQSKGKNMGTATVYRRLERLVSEGVVQKYIFESNVPACFAYIGESCDSEHTCFHCKCTNCGKLIHMHCEDLHMVETHLLDHHKFRLDPWRTVFYGLCEDCSKIAEEE